MFICALHCAVYEQFGKASDDADVLLVQTSLQIADTYAHAYGAVWHHCTYVRHQQECTPEENISADDTFMQNARNFWGMTVETTTTAGGQ